MNLILLVFALVLFIIAGLPWANPSRFNLMAWGLACCVASTLVSGGLHGLSLH